MKLGVKNHGRIETLGNKINFSSNSMGSKHQEKNTLAVKHHSTSSSDDIYRNKSNNNDLAFIPTGLKSAHKIKKSSLEK